LEEKQQSAVSINNKQQSAGPVNERSWVEYTRTQQYHTIARRLSEELLQSILSSLQKASRIEPDYARVPQIPVPRIETDYNPARQDFTNGSRLMEELQPVPVLENKPAEPPSPRAGNTVTIYTYPNYNDTTQMELDVPDFELKIITDF